MKKKDRWQNDEKEKEEEREREQFVYTMYAIYLCMCVHKE